MTEPCEIIAGDALSWRRDVDTDLAAHSFQYRFVGPASFNIDAVYSGGALAVAQTSGDTAAFTPGEYQWYLFALLAGERSLVDKGRLVIKDNPASLDAADQRSHAERMLALIDARLEGRIVTDHERYEINGRSLDRIPIRDLRELRKQYAWAAHHNKVARGVARPHRRVKFR